MNERLEELANQAEDYADGVVDKGGEFHTTYTKKLADLIVEECAKIAYEYDMPKMSGPGMIIANRIEDLFQ